MDIVSLQHPHHMAKDHYPESVVAIGYFDGVHKGHQQVIQTAVKEAQKQNRESAVMTFHPHPSVVLKKQEQHIEHITPLDKKLEVIESLGVDRVFLITFDDTLANLLPQQFVDYFFIGLNVKHVVAGFDFSYGKMGKGNMETLREHGQGVLSQTVVSKVTDESEKVSSSYIREQLQEGNVGFVASLLGRFYTVKGTVVIGDQRGRTIGYPTANIQRKAPYYLPKVGVYAVKVYSNGEAYYGMANVGYRPTFYDASEKPSIEVYLFDYNGDLYGEELEVEWHQFIREETKFNGVEQLVAQLRQDEQEIRDFFSSN
ncbi:bifunctional riboflavin kinase/FAD synthetase [Pontibacillus salicampi]|uniref:Riboflavin biosynthesis protein n=1 Tax=Pontibacillus salicampi TaxID=1449801 RepID=A0ABV6LP49_9BACI